MDIQRTRGNTRLTNKKHKQMIIDFIRKYRGEHGVSPSHEQIAEGIGLSRENGGNITSVINALIKEKWLYRSGEGKVRNLMLVQPPPAEYYWREENE